MHGTRTRRDEADTPALDALTYATSLEGGITRRQGKRGFHYRSGDGKRITDREALERIAALAIPPAYTDVLISPDPTTHLQATGRDARGRKQYRYHPGWSQARGRAKFALLTQFAASLPKIRERVDSDLRRQKPCMEKALATVVWLLDNLLIRIGNMTYAQENGSYGLTTLRNKHVKIDGSTVHFQFKGKSGKEWKLSHNDRRITRTIRMLQELPGQRLFQYIDADGNRHPISSQDVNAYIREAAGAEFSSRQFRTWGATRHAATALAALEPGNSQTAIARQINAAIDSVASRMVNTRAVCRSSYIHPLILQHFPEGGLTALRKIRVSGASRAARWMDEDEIRLLRWLKLADSTDLENSAR
ncbi:DNA topoisomerase IB [Pararhizobium antarcticum]|uniref:DNA topoisomerase n=1 Tax=Pararhizobium antarcticum TaxID=1798805 RepID=A0A657LVT5_9HYPH|nr:DNA topoisomerase IB [Pararhizobium antarcticum]OJF91951.1 DNA topoisomerase [Rhizobium sp. 58]OJF98334.1 DNA topoisomerase [Pararhizobium antarcticum]